MPSFGTSSLLAAIEPIVAITRTVAAVPNADRGTPRTMARCSRSITTLTDVDRFVMLPRPIGLECGVIQVTVGVNV